jgi:hypothetical protein
MTWALDGTAEREFAGTGPTVEAVGIVAAGGGTDNDDYMIFCVSDISGVPADTNFRLTSLVMSKDSDGSQGGAMTEIFRGRISRGPTNAAEDVQQFWVQRNADYAVALDFESAASDFRATMNASSGSFADWHLGVFIMRSDAMPLGGSILDFLEGGFSQIEQADVASDNPADSPDFGALTIANTDVAGDLGCHGRLQNAAATIAGTVPTCDVQSYNIFDTLLQNHTRVSAVQTSVIAIGIGMDANQCLGKTNTVDNAVLTLGAIRISESAVAGGPLIPFFDGVGDNGRTNEPDLSTSGAAPPEGNSPAIAQDVAVEDPPAGASTPAPAFGATAALLDSAARTATVSTPDQNNKSQRGVKLLLDVTVVAGGENLVGTIQGKDPISGKYYTILSTPEITSTGLVVITVHPDVITVANVAFNSILPDTWRAVVTHSAGGAHTYQLAASSLE